MPADQQPSVQTTVRRLLAIAVGAAVLGLVVTLSFGYADRDPRPHRVRIAVSASPAVRSQLDAGLQHAEPGGFVIVNVPSPRAAAQSVRSRSTAAAFVVPPSGTTTIVTAGASSLLEQQAITAALTGASDALHRAARQLDVVPLQTGDRAGLSSFVFTLGLLIPSVLGSVGLFLFGVRLRLWWRAAAAALFALLAACAGVLALDTVLGALTGAGGALIAIGFLGALSFVLFATALQSVVGLTGTGLAALAFIFVGNAISGGSIPIAFLPDGFRQIAPWLPNAAIVSGARDVVYFQAQHLGHPLLVLGLWSSVAIVVLLAVDLLHLSERRRTPDLEREIYGTPGIVHLTRRIARRRASPAEVAGVAAGQAADGSGLEWTDRSRVS
jgi:hypothetical protein